MTVHMDVVKLETRGENQIVDITDKVQRVIEQGLVKNGIACVFVPGSTAAVTTIEYEPGLGVDLRNALERLVPKGLNYEHEKTWDDGNGHSDIRAALIGPDLFIPIMRGKLMLGTWQQIVFIEFDVRPRDRTVFVQLVGE